MVGKFFPTFNFLRENIFFSMNLYIRYFDSEVLVYNVEEALDFLYSIPDLGMNPDLEADVCNYVESDMQFPKRYKVRPRVYFIIIKTTAQTMDDFKQKKALNPAKNGVKESPVVSSLMQEREGWYEGALDFKRVVVQPRTGKCEYQDTHVVCQCKAVSGMDCYNRLVEYLRGRVDRRSQFPAAKGKNFHFTYLGMWK